jgi:hypothetical protein
MVGDLTVGNNVDLWDTTSQVGKIHIGCGRCRNPMLAHVYGAFGMEYCIIVSPLMVFESMAQKNLFCPKSKSEMLWGISRHQLFLAYKGCVFEGQNNVNIKYFVEWGCLDSNCVEGFNNLGMKRISSLIQIHAPTTSFENEPIFIEFCEDSARPNSVSHNSDDSSNGHNNVPTTSLYTLG